VKLSLVIDELVEERGLDRDLLSAVICEGMLAAYEKKYPSLTLSVEHNKKTDELEVKAKKQIVSTVHNEDVEISLRKARNINPKAELEEEIWVPFEGKIGRIEIIRARQVIANKIRSIEAAAVYHEFINKKGTIVLGTIHKCERAGMTIKVGDALAFLPKSLSMPLDKCIVGYSIRALLKDVLNEPRGDSQLILDRASADFVRCLFELEVPEIFEKLVEIKGIARIPGYKTKVVVVSHDENIDPVGTCVGVGGVRIKPILKELGGEKIDVIPWSDSRETLIANALKPAVINRVALVNDKSANVWLDEDQRSLAIGKMGQNITLASQLTGVSINLVQSEMQKVHDEDQKAGEEIGFIDD
jgi:transcription termination/antitermination protein NusA